MARAAVDLAILGAGAAGMLSALLAAQRGMRVILIDPHFSEPNNLFASGGLFPAAGSRLQRAAGVADSPHTWLADLQAFAGDSLNQRIAQAVAEALPPLIDFLVDTLQGADPLSGRRARTWTPGGTFSFARAGVGPCAARLAARRRGR